MEELLILVEAVTQIINQEEAIALGMEVRQAMSTIEETRERIVEALIVQALQMILIMLVLVETVQLKAVHIQVLAALIMVATIILVLLERLVAQTIVGQVEVETLLQEVLQIAGREAHPHQVHRAGVVVVLLLQAVLEHQEARLAAVVEVAAVAAAVDQDN